jgi:hypothetical protein
MIKQDNQPTINVTVDLQINELRNETRQFAEIISGVIFYLTIVT